MKQILELGTAKVDITPNEPLPLAGFSGRTGHYEAIASRLYARIWLFRQNVSNQRMVQVVLVQADLIWWGSDRSDALIQTIKKRWGIDQVLLHATHTHSGPQTSARFTRSLGYFNEDYVQYLEEQVLQGIEEALAGLEPIRAEVSSGYCTIGVNRRKWDKGAIRMQPNPDGPIDPEVTVIRFSRTDDSVKGVMFHYTCHPTTTSINQLSSEFPGVAMEVIEEQHAQGFMASYLQGCCGEIRPAVVRETEFIPGTVEDVERLGNLLATEVLSVMRKPMVALESRLSVWGQQTVALPYADLPSVAELDEKSQIPGIWAEWSRMMLDQPERLQVSAQLELCGWQLADDLGFVGINGEPVLKYGFAIKQLSEGKALPLGYTNGMLGYIPSASQLAEGGYEAIDSAYYFGLAGPFAPEIEQRIMEACQMLLPKEFARNEDK